MSNHKRSYWEAQEWAWDQEGITSSEKLLLVALGKHANEDRTCYPSQARLMKVCCMSERTVQRAIQTLEEKGFITRTKRSSAGGRRNDLYRLNLPSIEVEEEPLLEASTTRQDDGLRNPSDRRVEGVKLAGSYRSPNTQLTPNTRASSREGDLDRFAEFWKLYPRRENKGAALKKWTALVLRGVKADDLISGARRYAAEMAGTEERFIRHPATWLNQDGWKDETNPNRNGSGLFVSNQRLDPTDDLIWKWQHEDGVLDEDLPARIRSWRSEQVAGVTA